MQEKNVITPEKVNITKKFFNFRMCTMLELARLDFFNHHSDFELLYPSSVKN